MSRIRKDATRTFESWTGPEFELQEVEPLKNRPEMAFLNEFWMLRVPWKPEDAGGFFRRRVKGWVRRLIGPPLHGFFANVVGIQNRTVERCDDVATEIRQLAQAMEAELRVLAERDQRFYEVLETRVARLEAERP